MGSVIIEKARRFDRSAKPLRRTASVSSGATYVISILAPVSEALGPKGLFESWIERRSAYRHLVDATWRPHGVGVSRSTSSAESERRRWSEYRGRLEADDSLSTTQRASILNVWDRIAGSEPLLTYPTTERDEDGAFHFSWNPPGRSLGIEIHSDGSLDWFFADHVNNVVLGSDDERLATLPPLLLTLLGLFRRHS